MSPPCDSPHFPLILFASSAHPAASGMSDVCSVLDKSSRTPAQAKAAAMQCDSSVEGFRNVIGTYLSSKQQNELARLRSGAPPRRAEWRFSRPDTRTYNHLMHKLETLSRSVVNGNPGNTSSE